MRSPHRLIACALAALLASAAPGVHAADGIERIDIKHGPTQWRAVIAPADKPLAHTAQIFPLDASGTLVGTDPVTQSKQLQRNLHAALQAAGTSWDRVVKLNVYCASPWVADAVRKDMGDLKQPNAPAIAFAVTPLPHGALVAADAVAVTDNVVPTTGLVAVLPAGGATYISGQAEKGKDLVEATRATMAGLGKTLEHLGLTKKDVVSVKSFFHPMWEVDAAKREIEAFFAPDPAPPMVWVETTQGTINEIEMVAAAPPAPAAVSAETVEHINLPWAKPSPVYSKLAVIRGGRMIYTSGLYASKPNLAPEEEVKDIFAGLQQLMEKSGSDMKHMAKATYHPAFNAPSTALNQLRPNYYDPKRAPAASKMMIVHTGIEGHGLTMDIIAATLK